MLFFIFISCDGHWGSFNMERCQLISVVNHIVEMKTFLWLSYFHNGIVYTCKTTSLYWNGALVTVCESHLEETRDFPSYNHCLIRAFRSPITPKWSWLECLSLQPLSVKPCLVKVGVKWAGCTQTANTSAPGLDQYHQSHLIFTPDDNMANRWQREIHTKHSVRSWNQQVNILPIHSLTHWGWDKMAAIFQTSSYAFSWMKMN